MLDKILKYVFGYFLLNMRYGQGHLMCVRGMMISDYPWKYNDKKASSFGIKLTRTAQLFW